MSTATVEAIYDDLPFLGWDEWSQQTDLILNSPNCTQELEFGPHCQICSCEGIYADSCPNCTDWALETIAKLTMQLASFH